ncbi:hypothetical protein Tco_1440441 [Tanacetum coccineum]
MILRHSKLFEDPIIQLGRGSHLSSKGRPSSRRGGYVIKDDDDDEDDTKDDEGNDDGDDSDGNDDDDDNDGDDDDDNDGNDDDDSDQERTESDRDEIPNLNQFNEEHKEEEEENVDEFTDKEDDEENEEESDDGEELYKDVNVNLRQEDVEMTDVDQGPMQSYFVSSDFTEKLLNFENVSPANNEIASLMDTTVCNKEPSDLVDSSVRTIIREEVNTQLPQILPKAVLDFATPVIERNVTKSLEVVVLAKSSSQPKSTYEAVASLLEYELTKILLDKMEESKSHLRSDYKKKHYDALVKSYNTDKDRFNTYGEVFTLKSSRDDKDKDQDLFARSDREMKRRKSSKEADHTVDDSRVQKNQEFTMSNNDEQLEDEAAPKNDWFKKPETFGKPYPFDLRKPLPLILDHRGRQAIPQDYFINNDLEYLKGGSLSRKYSTSVTKTKAATYEIKWIEDMVPNLWSPVKVVYDKHTYWGTSHWVTRLKIMKKYDYGHLDEIKVRIESYQKKINLTKLDTWTTYTAYSDPQGVIYKDQNNRNRLMRADELHKFSDGTLNDVRTALHDIASGIRMEYLPKRKWSGLDKRMASVMIQDIDKQLFQRRLIRNLEKFVGGKEYENDLRLLERTI